MPRVIDLSTLAFPQGFTVQGGSNDSTGGSVSWAGDVNGDGFADVIVGAMRGDAGGTDAGEAYVVFGHAGGFATVDLDNIGTAGFLIQGDAAGDWAGNSVSSAGDINGDGYDDVIVGARNGDDGGLEAGEAYVIFGHAGPFATIDLGSLGAAGFVVRGAAEGDQAGISVSSAGDVNGDGFSDIVIGAFRGDVGGFSAGQAYVIFGHAGGFTDIDTGGLGAAGFQIQGAAGGDAAGNSVASAGDVNGDGFDDLILGAIGRDAGGGTGSGGAYVIFGHAGPFTAIDLANLGTAGFFIQGIAEGDFAGGSVASAGDINADGFADLIVGATDGGSTDTGEAYVIFGHAGGFSNVDLGNLGTAGFVIRGGAPYDLAGDSVSSAGDVNGDGFADLIVGAPFADADGTQAVGRAYVIFGHAGTFSDIDLSDLGARTGFIVEGIAAVDSAGTSVSSAGDLNGDGFDDFIVGATGAGRGDYGGEAYVIFGEVPTAAVSRFGTAVANTIRGGAFDDRLRGLGGDDTLEGGGGDDRMFGGQGNDTASYEHAAAGVLVRLDLQRQETGGAGTDSLVSFENVTGSAFADTLHGSARSNVLEGNAGDDLLRGFGGRDTLDGGAGDDLIGGGTGRDLMIGGDGRDVFKFYEGETAATLPLADLITDFSRADRDKIHLADMDADTTAGGDQAFTFVGNAAFTGTAGELRFGIHAGVTYAQGDTDGDGTADFMIALAGARGMHAGDFIL